jgi:hypothetical protein
MADKIRIKVPKTVVVKDGTAAELRKVVEQMIDAMVAHKEVPEEIASKAKMALYERTPAAERDYPISEFIDIILNTAPQFTGGHSKVQRIAYRVGQAFEGATEGTVVELEPAGHDLLKAYFEKPEYSQQDEKGGKKSVEGVVFAPAVWRKCCPYVDAICEPMKDEPAAPVPPPAV